MPEQIATQFRTEGEPAFPVGNTENDNSASSSEGEQTEVDNTQSDEGDNSQTPSGDDPDKDKPFHEHPRWKEREDNWTNKFNEQEARHQEDMKKILEKLDNRTAANATAPQASEPIPSWFGGDQDQWNEYCAREDARLKAVSEQAREDAIKGISEKTEQEKQAIQEASDYMVSEIAAIESDKTLNPTGEKIDPNKLLKFVLEENLYDPVTLKWDYRKGYRLMPKSSPKNSSSDRKQVAGALASDSKAESSPLPYKTPEDFKRNRPW